MKRVLHFKIGCCRSGNSCGYFVDAAEEASCLSSKGRVAAANSLGWWAVETGDRHCWWLVCRMLVLQRQSHRDAWTTACIRAILRGHVARTWLSKSQGPSDPCPFCSGFLRNMILCWILVTKRTKIISFVHSKICFMCSGDVIVIDTDEVHFDGASWRAETNGWYASAKFSCDTNKKKIKHSNLMANDREGVRLSLHGFSGFLSGFCLLVGFDPFCCGRKPL